MESTNQLVSLYGSIYGSLYFSVVMSTAFYGVTCMQTFYYYVHYQNDSLRIKIFVATLWAINTIHEALTVSGVYKFIIAGLLDPLSFVTGNPELIILYLLTALVSVPAQGYFIYRLYAFSGKNIIAPLIWVVLALIPLVCSIIYVARSLYSADGIQVVSIGVLDSNPIAIPATLCFSAAAGVDILIAIFMTFLLLRKRSTAGFASTAHVLQRLTVFAVNTGIWTATFAVLSAIFLHLFPSNLNYAVFAVPLCSIYCNTVLANLNARSYFQADSTKHNKQRGQGMSSGTSGFSEVVALTDVGQSTTGTKGNV